MDFAALYHQFWPQTVDGLTLGSIYALIALGYTLVYGVLRLIGLIAMAASGLVAMGIERIAYRPLRRRGAPRLAALISAIGMSFSLQEVFGLRYGRDLLVFPRVMDKTR